MRHITKCSEIDKQLNITIYDDVTGWKLHLEDITAIMFDGRDAIIQQRGKVLVKHARCFSTMLICVEDRAEPLLEEIELHIPDYSDYIDRDKLKAVYEEDDDEN